MISQQTIDEMRNKLLTERKHLQESIQGMDEGGLHESLSSSISELSVYDNHPGDVASEVFERSKDFALREKAMLTLEAIDHALESMDRGTYGRCEDCGTEIPRQRLEALPQTTLCVHCKENGENHRLESSRPVEEAVLSDIYSKPFDDGLENVEVDWEDIFQEVADWNEHAPHSQWGSYYGGEEPVEEDDVGLVEDVEGIPYQVGEDGMFYKDHHLE